MVCFFGICLLISTNEELFKSEDDGGGVTTWLIIGGLFHWHFSLSRLDILFFVEWFIQFTMMECQRLIEVYLNSAYLQAQATHLNNSFKKQCKITNLRPFYALIFRKICMGHIFFGHHLEDEHIKRLFTIVVAPYFPRGPPFGGFINVRGVCNK